MTAGYIALDPTLIRAHWTCPVTWPWRSLSSDVDIKRLLDRRWRPAWWATLRESPTSGICSRKELLSQPGLREKPAWKVSWLSGGRDSRAGEQLCGLRNSFHRFHPWRGQAHDGQLYDVKGFGPEKAGDRNIVYRIQLPACPGLWFLLALKTNKNCASNGGSDQWGNIVTGTELIRRLAAGKRLCAWPHLDKKSRRDQVWKRPNRHVSVYPNCPVGFFYQGVSAHKRFGRQSSDQFRAGDDITPTDPKNLPFEAGSFCFNKSQ